MEKAFVTKFANDIMQVRAMSIKTAIDPDAKAKELDRLIAEELEKAKAKYEDMEPMEIIFEELEKLGVEVKEMAEKTDGQAEVD